MKLIHQVSYIINFIYYICTIKKKKKKIKLIILFLFFFFYFILIYIIIELYSLVSLSDPEEKYSSINYNPPRRRQLRDIDPLSVPPWKDDRIILLGDAAHAINPILGLGLHLLKLTL